MDSEIRYPIGEQSFENLRGEGALYVDKTDLVHRLVTGSRYYFLSRPRRFGKSLLISTLEAYFRGRRELFAGLALERLEKEWAVHPVLHIDFMGRAYGRTEDALAWQLQRLLKAWEQQYGIRADNPLDLEGRFTDVIRAAHEQTGRQVAVLVDEYDKPLLDVLGNEELFERNQALLQGFYGVLKKTAPSLRFVFLTGVTRFAHLNIFSGLNNLRDISMSKDYAALCGITEGELRANFAEGVRRLAESNRITEAEAYGRLKAMYDGYRFCADAPEGVYNPFSLLLALDKGVLDSYWYATGTPTFLFKRMVREGVRVAELWRYEMDRSDLDARSVGEMGVAALLYQTGYLTIGGFDGRKYFLRLPNGEVEEAFFKGLLRYLFHRNSRAVLSVDSFLEQIQAGEAEAFLAGLYAFFAWGDYRVAGEAELYFQNVLLIIFKLLGLEAGAELATSDGRVDLVVETARYVYLYELKLDRPAGEALAQIEGKRYAARYAVDSREVVKLGVSFSSATRNIEECIIRRAGRADVRMGVREGRLQAEGE